MAVPLRNARNTRTEDAATPVIWGRRSSAALLIVLLLVCILGLLGAYFLSIPGGIAAALIPAVAVEVCLYVAPGVPGVRSGLERRLSPPSLALCLALSALVPYSLYALPTGEFRWAAFGLLAALGAASSFWYVVLPRRPAADLAYVAFVAAAVLGKVFSGIYVSPIPDLRLDFLGQLMWIRIAIVNVLSIRGIEGTGFGFLPERQDWKIGLGTFACFLPVGILLGWALKFATFHPRPLPWWMMLLAAAGTFAGMLWVVALSEELFFRGLLQQWFSKWMGNRWAGLAAASILFGAVHLPFRGFPNWRFSTIAGVAGLFYGLAYMRTGSIRAGMVAHALVNTVWRLLFS